MKNKKNKDGRKPILWNKDSFFIGFGIFSVLGFISSWFSTEWESKIIVLLVFIVFGFFIAIITALFDKYDYS